MTTQKTQEKSFQNDIIQELVNNGWQLGTSDRYNRKLAIYEEDLLDFVKETQDKEWQKYCQLYPNNPEQKFIKRVAHQLDKVDPHAAHKEMRTFGTLGVLRNEIKDRGARFSLCQFKPEHQLNPDSWARYQKNRLRVVPELVYSPWINTEYKEEKAKAGRLDLVLFVNGLPIVTLELKSEFQQEVQSAVKQYKKTRLPVDPTSKKVEPLLTFKRGALVHFAVSQFEVFMTTHLQGSKTMFLPFNKGTKDGGKGNDVPQDQSRYATEYLWNEVLLPNNLLHILARFVHLQIEEREDSKGQRYYNESLIFPRYHQWDVVCKLVNTARQEGPGHKYLIQHSAGSGKSNSIAWAAHQLSAIYNEVGNKQFDSVIIVTDRTVLDAQLQDTIYQFERVDGVVCRINREEGQGSKSEKLAAALESSRPIIVVTIQTFPFVLAAIENSAVLKERKYAIIADEAHSSQTGLTARKLKEVLNVDGSDRKNLTADEIMDATMESRSSSQNLSYFAFTATPKPKTIELFGRLPQPNEPSSMTNKPQAFHVYSMRQAIEEGFILDVLKNYINYEVACKLALKTQEADQEVDSKRAKIKLTQWQRLHDYNIAQKVQIIVEHFKDNVAGLLNNQAKAMVITSKRKEAVRYKLGFDKYIKEKGYENIHAIVAFSGEVTFHKNDPNAYELLEKKFTENNMNQNLKGRDIRKAFDSDDYQVMIVANKFQTGFDQPKLCAMYVDKKLRGVDCVQTLSRLNRTYHGKTANETFVLDFVNQPQHILESFQPYYQIAELANVSDPNIIFDLFEKLRSVAIFQWAEVEQFCTAFFQKNTTNAKLANICKPAKERWVKQSKEALLAYEEAKDVLKRCKKTKDAVLIANAENEHKKCKKQKDALEIFKKDLASFTRFYEFMVQIVDYNDKDLEKLSIYARHLFPMLKSIEIADEIDLENIYLSHYRISKLQQQSLILKESTPEYNLEPGNDIGTAKPKNKKEEFMSQIVERLNEIFASEELSDKDLVNYAHTIKDKVKENKSVMAQIATNTPEQAMLGDFPKAIDNAIMESGEVHQKQMMQLLSNPIKSANFAKIILELLTAEKSTSNMMDKIN